MKKVIVSVFATILAATAMARGPHHSAHHHHHSGGFAAGVIGGAIVGGIIHEAIRPTPVVAAPVIVQPAPVVVAPTPVVVQPAPVVVQQPVPVVVQPQPVYQLQNVWVEGRYVEQMQANGTLLRVWQPGHYEQRQVQIQ